MPTTQSSTPSGGAIEHGFRSLAEHAVAYATGEVFGQPMAVFPLAPQGKLPLIRKEDGGRGYLDATTDLEQIRAWWSGTPDANIGQPLAPNGLCAVDLDGAEGLATWASLGPEYPGPVTCATQTGSGGAHLLYRVPQGRRPRGSVGVFDHLDG